ncbi:MAG TPA: hypothetical protein VHT97_13480 [Acidimicrobiales bacterium]|nr:hypothetical protein [Acidimicrobiales bacterium]
MPRIDIELTSSRPDGTWTWRAAGARQPKGVVAASVLHDGAKVGDVLKAEADFDLDGINVTSVTAPKAKKAAPEVLPILGSGKVEELVTQSPGIRPERDGGDRSRRGDRGDRFGSGRPGGPGGRDRQNLPGGPGTTRPRATPGPRPLEGAPPPRGAGPGDRDRPRGDRPPGDRPRGERPGGDHGGRSRPSGDRPGGDRPGGERPRGERPGGERPGGERPRGERPRGDRPGGDRPTRERTGRPAPAGSSGGPARPGRPPAKRLQPGRAHREAVLAALAPEQRAIAEQVLRGGLAGVRQAVDEQNNQAKAAGGPEIRADAILGLAEELLPGLRAAEWRDRAEAAVASVDEISLRDLRTVVAGADAAGRDEESRALAAQLREGLDRRATAERQAWTDEITTCLAEGRVVRALRVSGRAPEQGLRMPPELSASLSSAAGDAMTADTAVDRWMALLEAVLSSPARRSIQPKALPAGVDEETRKTLRQAISKVPALGSLLGESPGARPVPPPPPRRPPAPPAPGAQPAAPEAGASEPVAAEPTASGSPASGPTASEPVASEPVASEPVASGTPASEPVASEPVAAEGAAPAEESAMAAAGPGPVPEGGSEDRGEPAFAAEAADRQPGGA